jgi:arabinogalactan endo-1,4-beta-galactosidase
MRSLFTVLGIAMLLVAIACKKQVATTPVVNAEAGTGGGGLKTASVPGGGYFRGADVSGLSKYEDLDSIFYNEAGHPDDCLNVMKEKGINSIRLRVWVDAAGYSGKKDVATMAKRANDLGMKVMIDFHLSHTWADKDWQKIPPSWMPDSANTTGLGNRIYNHIYGMLDTLRTLGVTPEWVQVGNESDKGILVHSSHKNAAGAYPPLPGAQVNFSSTAGYDRLAALINRGYDAVKAINTSIKVIIHLSDVTTAQAEFYFDHLQASGGKFDMIGFSVYPDTTTWQGHINGNIGKFQDMNNRYHVPVMVCEIGMNRHAPTIARNALTMMMDKSQTLSSPGVAGMFYWEPESLTGTNGAFAKGRPLLTMEAYRNDMKNEAGQVSNYSFEFGGAATQTPTGWTTNSTTSTPTADYTTAGGFIGAYQLSHYYTASAYQVSTHQIKTGLANGTYQLSAWIQSSGGQTTCQLFAKDFGGTEQHINVLATGSWTYMEVPNIVVTNGQCDFGLRSNSPAGKWCHMDDVAFYKTN